MKPDSLSCICLASSFALMLLPGCQWPLDSGSDYREVVAGVAEVTAPDTVNVGNLFVVVAISEGTNGCWRKGRDVVRKTELAATIICYDREYVGDNACTDNLPLFQHSVALLAPIKGTFQVRVVNPGRVGVISRNIVVR